METETITVTDVDKKPSGWIEITTDDGRTISTKNQELADEAFKTRGTPVEAVINVSKKGAYTNLYLNAINGVTEEKPKRVSGRFPVRSGGGRDAETQERIARQWAYGRAVELAASAGDFTLPLSDADKASLSATAEWLLEKTK